MAPVAAAGLSRESAVALSSELAALADSLRVLEAKYGLKEDVSGLGSSSDPGGPGLGAPLLAALRPFARDPAVAANVLRGGLDLCPDLPARWASTSTSTGSESSEELPSRSATKDSGIVVHYGRQLQLTPRTCSCPEHWAITVEHLNGASVRDLRRDISRRIEVPLGKVRLLGGLQEGDVAVLGDTEPAAKATMLYISSVAVPVQPPAPGDPGHASAPRLPRETVLAVQRELLDSVMSIREAEVSKEQLRELQCRILPKYGFQASPTGVWATLKAFDAFAGDLEIAELADSINERLGLRPQVYTVEEYVDVL